VAGEADAGEGGTTRCGRGGEDLPIGRKASPTHRRRRGGFADKPLIYRKAPSVLDLTSRRWRRPKRMLAHADGVVEEGLARE